MAVASTLQEFEKKRARIRTQDRITLPALRVLSAPRRTWG